MRKAAALLFVAPFLLAGCAQADPGDGGGAGSAGEAPVVLDSRRGLPKGMRPAAKMAEPVAAIMAPGRLALATWGSSTCPSLPVRAKVTRPDTLRVDVRMEAGKGQVCTMDLGPTTTRIGVDPALTEDGAVQLLVEFGKGREDVRLTARPVARG